MYEVINNKRDMIIPSVHGIDLIIKKGVSLKVCLKDYQNLISIYGKEVEGKKVKEVLVRVSSPAPFEEEQKERREKRRKNRG